MTTAGSSLLHASLREERGALQRYHTRIEDTLPTSFASSLKEKKLAAVAGGHQSLAKAIWCLETVGESQDVFIEAFADMKAGLFESAWVKLEQCDIVLHQLRPHFAEINDRFGIRHMTVHLRQFQELYPYTFGISPAFVFREVECSICSARLYLRPTCEHVSGEIYDGEMCGPIITNAELIEISLVENPSQKYSVIFPFGDEDPRLAHLKHVCEILGSPWTAWTYERETRTRHFGSDRRIRLTDECPCGSRETFGQCECPKELTFPHFEIAVGNETAFDPWGQPGSRRK